jgi:Na+-translocating ferredoxin:NAD+ oxidoreductase RnfG subunit
VDQTCRHTAEKIEDEISNVAEPIFNIIPEDIEKPHIHENVKESSVKKHGTQERKILFKRCKMSREFWIGVS